MPAALDELIGRMAIELSKSCGRGGLADEEVAAIAVRWAPRSSVASTASCVGADDILGWLCSLRRDGVACVPEGALRRSEFISRAEAVALAQRAVDRGYLERVGLGSKRKLSSSKKYWSQLRAALLDDEDRVATRRRRVFRAGSSRHWRFVLPRIFPEEDVVRVAVGRVRLPRDAAGVLPSVGYVSACVRVDLVVAARGSCRWFPRQRHRTTMVRRPSSIFDVGESVDFAMPRAFRDHAFFVVEILNEAAHGVLHAKRLGATCVPLSEAMRAGTAEVCLVDRDGERAVCNPATTTCFDATSSRQQQRSMVLATGFDDPRQRSGGTAATVELSVRESTVTTTATLALGATRRVRCVVHEARNVVYDLAETHGLGWSLQARLIVGGDHEATPWKPKIFHHAHILAHVQRVGGGGARFSFSREDDSPSRGRSVPSVYRMLSVVRSVSRAPQDANTLEEDEEEDGAYSRVGGGSASFEDDDDDEEEADDAIASARDEETESQQQQQQSGDDEEFVLPRDSDVFDDDQETLRFFPKLSVDAAAQNLATDAARLVVLEKSRGGIPRRVGAAVVPLASLPTSQHDPEWHILVNVGPRGVLTRNGELKASLWVEDVGERDHRERKGDDPSSRRRWLFRRRVANVVVVAVGTLFAAATTATSREIVGGWTVFFLKAARTVSKLVAIALAPMLVLACHVCGPVALGWLASFLIVRYALRGACVVRIDSVRASFFITRGADVKMHAKKHKLVPRSAPRWRLALALEVRGFQFGNPAASNYPHQNLVSAACVNLVLSIALRDAPRVIRSLVEGPWRPSPRQCFSAFAFTRNDDDDDDEKAYAGVAVVETLEIRSPEVNLELDAAGELNVVALARDIADAKVARYLRPRQLAPNALYVRVVAARDLLHANPGQLLVARCHLRADEYRDTGPSAPLTTNGETEWRDDDAVAAFNNARCCCDDASAVLALDLFAVDPPTTKRRARDGPPTSSSSPVVAVVPKSGAKSLGRWLTTLEALANNPENRLVRTDDLVATAGKSASSRFQVSGWFPLRDSATLEYSDPARPRATGFGALRLVVTWRHEHQRARRGEDSPARWHRLSPPKSALDQLVENSRESALRIGSPRYTKRMLETFPLLFLPRNVSLFDVNVRLHDVFMSEAQAVVGAGDHARVQIPKLALDAATFRRQKKKDGDRDASNLFEFLHAFVVKGCGPLILSPNILYQVISAFSGGSGSFLAAD